MDGNLSLIGVMLDQKDKAVVYSLENCISKDIGYEVIYVEKFMIQEETKSVIAVMGENAIMFSDGYIIQKYYEG